MRAEMTLTSKEKERGRSKGSERQRRSVHEGESPLFHINGNILTSSVLKHNDMEQNTLMITQMHVQHRKMLVLMLFVFYCGFDKHIFI